MKANYLSDKHSDHRLALLHWMDLQEIVLVRLPTSPRDHEVRHKQKAWAPKRNHPKHHSRYRVHARPRHDRYAKSALIRGIAKVNAVVRRTVVEIGLRKSAPSEGLEAMRSRKARVDYPTKN